MMQLSFCTTSMNRLHQLRQTLPQNMEEIRSSSDVELMLLNYNSQDALDEWVYSNFWKDIQSGKLRYAHERTVTSFHMSKAKNLAHRLSTGHFLVNLDGDNFIGGKLNMVFQMTKLINVFYHGFSGNFGDGTCGRIGMSRVNFDRLGGYDEKLHPCVYEDIDLMNRALALKMTYYGVKHATAISNTKEETAKYCKLTVPFAMAHKLNKLTSDHNIKLGNLKANADGFTPHTVELNYAEIISL